MQIGVVFPTTEIGDDPVAIKDYAQAAEALGFRHLLTFDHVLGANMASRPGWKGFYDHTQGFHEPFVLFGFLASLVPAMELITGVVILPQRQTALVAKQAAEVALLTGGRLRLGVGLGWNDVEYEALGQDFASRGDRVEEQIDLMRKLWANELVTYSGRWDKVTDAGLNPLPPGRSIPIWMGSIGSERALRRVARLADGWIATGFNPGPEEAAQLQRLRGYVAEAGRDPATFGLEAMIRSKDRTPDDWVRHTDWWRQHGATHCALDTMGCGLRGATAHIEALHRYRNLVPVAA
jgi:probable F420-dependent oxidoreductase